MSLSWKVSMFMRGSPGRGPRLSPLSQKEAPLASQFLKRLSVNT